MALHGANLVGEHEGAVVLCELLVQRRQIIEGSPLGINGVESEPPRLREGGVGCR